MIRTMLISLLTSLLMGCFSVCRSYGQISYSGPAVIFSYDHVGNRLVRQIHTICLGPGCPPEEGGLLGGKPASPRDSTKGGTTTGNDVPAATDIAKGIVVEAYPNPADEELYIENKTWHETDKAIVIVYDIEGKIAVKKDFTQAKDRIMFNNMVPGTYIVQYYLNEVPTQTWKIIKR